MVTASRLYGTHRAAADLAAAPVSRGSAVHICEEEDDNAEEAPSEGSCFVESEGTYLEEFVAEDLPLSFGEQLVLETYLRCRTRAYSKRRQEELAKPKRRAFAFSPTNETVPKQHAKAKGPRLQLPEARAMIERLAKPKPKIRSLTPEKPAKQVEVEAAKRRDFNVHNMVERLATPRRGRRFTPPPGERVVLMHCTAARQRPHDAKRIEELAQPTRRGGGIRCWGVQPKGESKRQTPERGRNRRPLSQNSDRSYRWLKSPCEAGSAARPGSNNGTAYSPLDAGGVPQSSPADAPTALSSIAGGGDFSQVAVADWQDGLGYSPQAPLCEWSAESPESHAESHPDLASSMYDLPEVDQFPPSHGRGSRGGDAAAEVASSSPTGGACTPRSQQIRSGVDRFA